MKWTPGPPTFDKLSVAIRNGDLVITDNQHNEVVTVGRVASPRPTWYVCGSRVRKPRHIVVGKGLCRRDVYHYATKANATWLRAGVTVHRSAFSSLPHDFELTPENGFEEFFLFNTTGSALVERRGRSPLVAQVDDVVPVINWNAVQIPMGWHRVVALPDRDGNLADVTYVWAYLAKKPHWEKI